MSSSSENPCPASLSLFIDIDIGIGTMAPRLPTELNLEPPILEEDIGDLSPYLSLPTSISSQASSSASTFGSSIGGSSPRNIETDNESDSDIPFTSRITSESMDTPRRTTFSKQFPSPSSPSLPKFPEKPPQILRAHTLPRGVQSGGPSAPLHQISIDISYLDVDLVYVAKIRRWILGMAVVEFDLDTGPIVEGIHPPLSLSPSELENMFVASEFTYQPASDRTYNSAFCAFPDSIQFDQGSQTHSFRIRGQTINKQIPMQDGFIYGFSHFIQRRDPSSKRGYSQRSLVILTQYQYPALYSSLADIFGPLFERHGIPMLEAACHNIATWPDPTPGSTIELGFLGTVLHVEIPHSIDVQQVTETASFNEKYDPRSHILATTASFSPPPLLLFEASLGNLWSIWECLVLCEPILVFGASPAQTSQAVWWLRDLLRPIPLAGDIRPYFTMQDSDHSQFVNKLPPKAGLILGVTNPFFEKSCAHWPHVLSLGRRIPPSSSLAIQRSPILGAPAGPPPGWKTKTHKRYISKDRALLKQLENAVRRDDKARMEASLALRRHFCSRSTQLITPLARYLNSLIPSPTEVQHARKLSAYTPSLLATSSFSSTPSKSKSVSIPTSGRTPASPPTPASKYSQNQNGLRLKPFNNANFLASLKAHGSILPFKSTNKRIEFYERWLKSPAFGAWLAQQEQIVQSVLNEPPPPPPPPVMDSSRIGASKNGVSLPHIGSGS